jgi:hypothetical protein
MSIGVARGAWLLTRLRLRRQLNAFETVLGRRKGRSGRKLASRASPTTWLINGLVALAMLGSFTLLSHQMMRNLQTVLGSEPVLGEPRNPGIAEQPGDVAPQHLSARPLPPEPGSMLARDVRQGAVLAALFLLLGAFLTTVANREITRPDWDLEWLVTLPLPRATLLGSMMAERVVSNHFGLLTLGTFLSILAWSSGYRWMAPLLGLGATLALLVMVAALQVLVDTGLRLALSPPRLRNIHAVISLGAVLPMLLPMTMAMHDGAFAFRWALALPEWVSWLPSGLAVRALAAAEPGTAAFWAALMMAEILLLTAVALIALAGQMRGGVVAAGARQAVTRRPRRTPSAATEETRALLSPVQRRELRLLGRDRTFMVQTLVLPATMLVVQIVLNPNATDLAGIVGNPSLLATLAFLLAAYTLMFSAFQALNAEGQALWILHCVPHSLESVLWQKAKLWAAVAVLYPVIMFGTAIALEGEVPPQLLGGAVVVLLGVPIFAVIATALGVFGYDPLVADIRHRIRLAYGYLFMLLCSLYGYAIFAETVWQQVTMVTLTALVAVALWQKVRDQLPYLLDPAAVPPSRVSVADGLIAALLFFVLQAIVFSLQTGFGRVAPSTAVWIAFCAAGAVTFAVMRLVYRWSGTTGIPRFLGPGLGRALLWGVGGGLAAALVGFVYIQTVRAAGLVPGEAPQIPALNIALWLAVVAIGAAPVFEEFIFRGLLFGGLRRSFRSAPAVLASAAIFAIVHPPVSMLPVFCLGLCTALVYDRTRMLAAPITVHAIYNAVVIGFQWGLPPAS